MMLECSTGELLARAAFMHHDDQGYEAFRHYAVLKGLIPSVYATYRCGEWSLRFLRFSIDCKKILIIQKPPVGVV